MLEGQLAASAETRQPFAIPENGHALCF